MHHNPRFLEIVGDAKSRVQQNDVQAVKEMLETDRRFYLVDVREDNEWNAGHLPRAIHLGNARHQVTDTFVAQSFACVCPDTYQAISRPLSIKKVFQAQTGSKVSDKRL